VTKQTEMLIESPKCDERTRYLCDTKAEISLTFYLVGNFKNKSSM